MAVKGWPDYTRVTGIVENYDEYAQNYPVGIGDGAARLGSIKTYDPRGRVYWMDDLEAPTLHWGTWGAGVGGSQALVSDYVRNGEQALGLQANTGAGRISRADRVVPLPRNVAIGIELHISQEAGFDIAEIQILIDDGAQISEAEIQINEALNQIRYLDDTGVHQDTGINPGLSNNLMHFHALKIVVDYNTDTWLRVLWDDQEINMAGILMRPRVTLGMRFLYIMLDNYGDGIANARMCFDDCIISVMEPE